MGLVVSNDEKIGMETKYDIYSSIDRPGLFEVHDRSGYKNYVIQGSREKCQAFLDKWNK